ncbi:Protein of unknown function [Bacillus wiedmannii]|uniref:Uncharacterized protein n=2 Tax=Bacillus cereus group TaxID=86661 RepID=A0A1C3ZGZ7_BACTU|nr:Protein of unknown function [Bacillus wiedmannii]SCB81687.1 Protein of unknown function [Bacillus thuringiensis]SCL82165.1 Protein of unknown function [Bacillus wiedmannii]
MINMQLSLPSYHVIKNL